MSYSQQTDPFFVMLRNIRAVREQAGLKADAEAALAALQQLRDDAAEEVAEIGQLQEELRSQAEVLHKAKEAE